MFNPRYTSFFIIFYVVYSYYYSFKRLSGLGSCVLITSVIHHNKLMNIRKYDISISFSIILYHLYLYSYLITKDYYTWLPCLFYVLGGSSYLLSLTTPKPDLPKKHIFYDKYHGYYHIYGLIGNIIFINCLKNNNLLQYEC
jgi:hypothetical protein